MTNKHKMQIGSIAKLITAAGMMRLYEQGKGSIFCLP
ncbi:MAG: CubicO group peptidase (beta-lactamase class C family) [Flavobacteriales bacterium]|jgi:CubicO group peptidase (beta-lactamase class C family)